MPSRLALGRNFDNIEHRVMSMKWRALIFRVFDPYNDAECCDVELV
jgi:hypothetical protein